LRAIADKLIPGIPEKTRVAILQQTSYEDANTDETPEGTAAAAGTTAEASQGRTVLEEVIERATAKDELEKEIKGK